MKRGNVVAVVVVLVLLGAVGLPARAQSGEYATFVSNDMAFGFAYPADWQPVIDAEYGTVDVLFGDSSVFVYPPVTLKGWGLVVDSPVQVLKLLAPDWELRSSDVQEFFDGALVFTEAQDANGDLYYNLVFALSMSNGSFALMDSYIDADDFEAHVEDLMVMASTMDTLHGRAVQDPAALAELDASVQALRQVVRGEAVGPGGAALHGFGAGGPAAMVELQPAR